jgi:hypothetical protein
MTIFSPWMVRNYRLTGNPVYPLYNHHLGKHDHSPEISNLSMKPWLQRKLIYREPAWLTALIPLRIFFQGQDDHPRYFDGKLNPMLCLFPLLLFFRRVETGDRLTLELNLLLLYSVLFILYASFMVDMRIRYIAPTIPPLVVLTVLGIDATHRWINGMGSKKIQKLSHFLIISALVFSLFMNARYVNRLFQSVNPLPYVFGKISREEYLKGKLPDFEAIKFVNQIQSDHMKVMALFVGNRLYYFDKPVEFVAQRFASMVEGSSDETRLAAKLCQNGFTHCMIGIQHFASWANHVFSIGQQKIVSQWFKHHCRLLYTRNGYAVYIMTQNTAITDHPE